MGDIKVPIKKSLDQRLKEALKQENISLAPPDEKPEKATKPVPSIDTLGLDMLSRSRVGTLCREIHQINMAMADLKADLDTFNSQLISILSKTKFKKGLIKVNEYTIDRHPVTVSTANTEALLCAVAAEILAECITSTTTDTIEISLIEE